MSEIVASYFTYSALKVCLTGLTYGNDALPDEENPTELSAETKEKLSNCLKNFAESQDLANQAYVNYLHTQPLKTGLQMPEL